MPARRQAWEHGTVFGYDKRACRCEACRQARRDYDQARYARIADLRKQQVEVWRDANREKARGYSRAQYHRAPEKAAARWASWAARNPDAVKAAQVRYQQTDKARVNAAVKAATRRGLVTDEWTAGYVAVLLGDPCSYCGAPGGTVDHIIPVSKGGTSEWHNLTAACGFCNSSKRDHDLIGFLSRKVSA